TGPLNKKRMETIDEEVTEHALSFIEKTHRDGKPFFVWYNTTGMHFRTHCAEKHKGKSGQGDYNDVMVAHDEHIGAMLAKLDTLSIADNRLSCTRPTTGPTIIAGRMPALLRFAAKRTPIGREAGACLSSSAGQEKLNRAPSSMILLHIRTGCLHCLPPPGMRRLRRSC